MVTRTGDNSTGANVGYTTGAASVNDCGVMNGIASARCDYATAVGRLRFAAGETVKTIAVPIVDDAYAEGSESFSISLNSPSGASLGSATMATIRINDNESTNGLNPIDQAEFFVRQHYIEFLTREPDPTGLAFWRDQITSCGADSQCVDIRRINASAAFFLSIEFRATGYLVYRMYKAAYGNLAGAPVPIRLGDFLPDTREISNGLVVGLPGWEQVAENNKNAFAAGFVTRSRFTIVYPTTMSPALFVDTLYANAGVSSSAAERAVVISEFGSATTTGDAAARARVLLRVAENSTLAQLEFNKAFVLMQYFAYLRRSPDDAPDADFTGFAFWLSKLDQFNGNFVNAEMVKAFLLSAEYRERFGP
jgi:hypothetical protein